MKSFTKILLLALLVAITSFAATSCELLFDFLIPDDFGNAQEECKHVFVTETVAPTCLERGYDIDKCKLCGVFSHSNYTNVTGHTTSEWIIDKDATENEFGKRHKECLVCGVTLEQEDVHPHVHDMITVAAVAPTCTTAGHAKYEYCLICGVSTYVQSVAFGHDFSSWTSLGNGTHTRICANDASHVEISTCRGDSSDGSGLPICEICGVAYAFASRPGNSSYGYYALAEYRKGEAMQQLYVAMRDTCEDFIFSADNIKKDEYDNFVIGRYDIDKLSLTSDEAMGVWKLFYVDNPSYYWLSSTVVTVGGELHLAIDADYAKYESRAVCDEKIAERIALCNALITDDMSDLEVAMTIVEYIVSTMEYAYDDLGNPSDDAWAHNLTGFAMHGSGVCESYTKAFMHLCLLNGVECIVGSGYAGDEKHAWNYVLLEGAWYTADITWTDNSGDVAVYDYFGVADNDFHADHTLHPSDSFGVDFIYEIPEISETSLELCELFVEGESLGIFTSLEAAFAEMTDPVKEYEIKLGFYSFYDSALEYTISLESLPLVKKITLTGVNQFTGDGYLDRNTLVHVGYNVKINSDLELTNVEVEGAGTLYISKHTLTLSGDSVFLRVEVTGATAGNTVEVKTEDAVYFMDGIDVYEMFAEDKKLVFGKSSKIKILHGGELYIMGEGIEIRYNNMVAR